jgi:hypothetical protein
MEAIRDRLIDDCALAAAVKRSGGRVYLGLTAATASVRSYGSFAEIGRMIARTAFCQLRHSVLMLGAALAALAAAYLLPAALLFTGHPPAMALGAVAWAAMSIAYLPMVRFYGRSPLWAPALPLVALFYMAMTVRSAINFWLGRGGQWKGRAQDVTGRAGGRP